MLPKLSAQISPGDLVDYHADLEGMFNCTQCHQIGKKVSDEKCLECHELLGNRIIANKGYHASTEIKSKNCIECHSDHHGRKFEIIRFDEDAFDHRLTDYNLEGEHNNLECKACHKAAYIEDPLILKKKYTYLGLTPDCLRCHEDVHQNTLSKDCASCHNFKTFEEAERFKHADTDFPLVGEHKTVDCKACHEVNQRDGKDFQAFANIEFSSCASCHQDIHNGRFGNDCRDCHSETSFQQIKANSNFNHNRTDFPLRGSHRKINCKACHTDSRNSKSAFQEFSNQRNFECILCHTDIHENKFGVNCKSCHNETSFKIAASKADIDHTLTDFPLEGAHEIVDCRECHVADMTDPVAFNNCTDCHSDYHQAQFLVDDIIQDCKDCHTVQSFKGSLFSFEQHANTGFPLDGAHLATPCFSCHLKNDTWEFRNIGEDCVDCHEDIHETYLDRSFYPEQNCASCHKPSHWNAVDFNHEQTNFKLEGKHLSITCGKCHLDESREENKVLLFSLGPITCENCHNDVHYDQFSYDDINSCDRCHGFNNWESIYFKHDSTNFILEGAHLNIECGACHKPDIENEVKFIRYKIEKFECIDCHQ